MNNHIIKSKNASAAGICLRKCNSQPKEICLALIFGLILAAGVTVALVAGLGIRKCEIGLYKDGANCLSCQKIFGDLCIECDGPKVCSKCPPLHFFDSQNMTCASC